MHKSREILLGKTKIGGENPPVLQTMVTTTLSRYEEILAEANRALDLGCNIVRTAFKDKSEFENLKRLVKNFKGEIIADIHFDYKLALLAVDANVSGIRINPGNIGGKERVAKVVEKVKSKNNMAIRIGVNSGSIEKEFLDKYGGATTEALVESTKKWTHFLEKDLNFLNFKISAKSSSVIKTILACKEIVKFTNAPLHVGITEAGGGKNGIIKSAAGIGILIYEGLADTFRVSLTAPIEEEIKTGFSILKAMGKLKNGGEIVSCPTCGRTHGTLFKYYNRLEKWFEEQHWWLKKEIKVALMGCEVNGPGEAKEADIGIALGNNSALFFEKGKIKQKFSSQDEAFEELLKQIELYWNNTEIFKETFE